jgi:hypothetical protein
MEEKLRKKRQFILKRLVELGYLPEDVNQMNQEQSEIYKQIWSGNFDYWETVKNNHGWTTKTWEGEDKEIVRKNSEKRGSVRTYLRRKGILPPYGEELNEEQKILMNEIDNNNFTFYNNMVNENVKKHTTPKYKLPLLDRKKEIKDTEGYTAVSTPKNVLFALRRLQVLPPLTSDLNDEHKRIIDDVNNNWFGKKKSFFLHKYLHLSTPEGRLLHRLYKSHQDFGFNFNLSHEDIVIPMYCPLLNIELSTNPEDKDKPNYYTVDRIDSSKGLVKGNIQVISMRANKMKNKATETELLQFATNALKMFENGI